MTEDLTEKMNLTEALLFASPEPQSYKKLSLFLGKLSKGEVYEVIAKLNEKYAEGGHSFRVREIADGFQICLLPNMGIVVEKFLKRQHDRRLSQAGLETLAIIAYKQPVTKGEIEHIRGVNIDGTLGTLLERKLVAIIGRSDKIGHPLLYGTTSKFLEYFGLRNLEELPRIEEFAESFKKKKETAQQELGFENEQADSVGSGMSSRLTLKRGEELDLIEADSLEGEEAAASRLDETE